MTSEATVNSILHILGININTNNGSEKALSTFNVWLITAEVLDILKISVSKSAQQKYRSNNVTFLLLIHDYSDRIREPILEEWFIIKLNNDKIKEIVKKLRPLMRIT